MRSSGEDSFARAPAPRPEPCRPAIQLGRRSNRFCLGVAIDRTAHAPACVCRAPLGRPVVPLV
eukprot:9225101-Pyramimonas_sp.AAC.1